MQWNPIKLSFFNERVLLNDGHEIIFRVNCGLKYSVLKNLFKQCGFSNIPSFVIEALKKRGFQENKKHKMYVRSFYGIAKCFNDTFNEEKGIKIAENRAKIKAYKYTCNMLNDIMKVLANCKVALTKTVLDMMGKMSTKEQYLEKLKTNE